MPTSTHPATSLPTDEPIAAAAARLSRAAARYSPCSPVRDLIGETDVASAYAVQKSLTVQRLSAGAKIVGRKIGLTSEAVQRQLGVHQPDFGVLFDDMAHRGGDTISLSRLLQPKVEAEIAFILSADLSRGPYTAEGVRSAVAHVVAALEVVDSRISGWDIGFTDTVADNASSGLFVLGPERRTLSTFEPRDAKMQMTFDGAVVSTGNGRACLGDPLTALAWLAETAAGFGEPLRAGEVVLSGALGPMHALNEPGVVRAEITGLGSVNAEFVREETGQTRERGSAG